MATTDYAACTTGDLLNRFKGKTVTVLLAEGGSLTGKLQENVDFTSAFTKQVHLSELEGREFYDAVISIGMITGVVFRAK